MLAVPPVLLKLLQAGGMVAVAVEGDRLIVELRRKTLYALEELLTASDLYAAAAAGGAGVGRCSGGRRRALRRPVLYFTTAWKSGDWSRLTNWLSEAEKFTSRLSASALTVVFSIACFSVGVPLIFL